MSNTENPINKAANQLLETLKVKPDEKKLAIAIKFLTSFTYAVTMDKSYYTTAEELNKAAQKTKENGVSFGTWFELLKAYAKTKNYTTKAIATLDASAYEELYNANKTPEDALESE